MLNRRHGGMQHLSSRLVWHDSGWDGRVCSAPRDNSSCVIHEHVRENKDDDLEEEQSGKQIKEIDVKDIPPCARDPGAFSPEGSHILHEDPLERPELKPVYEEIPPYSFCTCPYDEMTSDDPNRTWESDPEIQEERLADFFDLIEQDGSLVFFYVKDGHPLKDDGRRIVVGVSRVSDIEEQVFFRDSEYPVWARTVTHNFPNEGVRIPYQEYLDQGLDTENIVCEVPQKHTDSFSYVANHVSDDIAIEVLRRILEVLKQIKRQGEIEGNWDDKIELVDGFLTEVWGERGLNPGMKGVINHLDETDSQRMGELYQQRIQPRLLQDGKDPLSYFEEILSGSRSPPEFFNPGVLLYMQKLWEEYSEEQRELVRTLSGFDLSGEQVSDVMWTVRNGDEFTIEELRKNIYILAEPRGYRSTQEIPFDVIDRGAAPDIERLEGFSISDFPGFLDIHLSEYRGRVRALLANALEEAAITGDTILSIDEAIKLANRELSENQTIDITPNFVTEEKEFFQESLNVHLETEPEALSLPKYREMDREIGRTISRLVTSDISGESVDWRAVLDRVLEQGETEPLDDETEKRAREEKTLALRIVQNSRFSVLKGGAGTGKTTVVESLLEGLREVEGERERLLLAPTGKARVRLEEIANTDAKTIHQFLMENKWLDPDRDFKFKQDGEIAGVHTVIIDEASMIPSDLLATLFRSLDFNQVRRMVLIGDPNQLPPIGPGRPFFDIIRWLEDNHPTRIAELRQQVRQTEGNARELADVFAEEREEINDTILSKVATGSVGGDLQISYWEDPNELRELIEKTLTNVFSRFDANDPQRAFEMSTGYLESHADAEDWQILSPTRIREHGTNAINRQIQERYRGHLIRDDDVQSFGEEQLVEGDKVIQTVNERRGEGWNETYVANGEIGVIDEVPDLREYEWYDQPDYAAKVRFTTQNAPLEYGVGDIKERKIELAYGLTVHKAQGSEFDTSILVLPKEAPTLSRELLYTALTRYKEEMVLLVEGDASPLLYLRKLKHSEIRKRSTYVFEPLIRSVSITEDDAEEEIYYPESLIHKTINDELVRSKSEVIIANTLENLGISYVYEKRLNGNETEGFKLPDFTVYYEGETYYWEHLGLLNDESYRKRWEKKRQWYERHDYSDKLIITRDDREGGIDSKWIEEKARQEIMGL